MIGLVSSNCVWIAIIPCFNCCKRNFFTYNRNLYLVTCFFRILYYKKINKARNKRQKIFSVFDTEKAAFFAAFSFTSEFFLKTYQRLIFGAKLTISFAFYPIVNTN